MRKLARIDAAVGVILGALGLLAAWEALRYPYQTERGPGPGFEPLWLALSLVALSTVLIVRSVIDPRSSNASTDVATELHRSFRRPAILALSIAALIVFAQIIGFYISFLLQSLFVIGILERRAPVFAVAVSVVLTGALYATFTLWLGLPLRLLPFAS